jgi:hypothetical protein
MGDTTTTLSCANLELGGYAYHGLMNNCTNVFPTQAPLDFSRGELKMSCVVDDSPVGSITAVGAIVSGSGYTPGAQQITLGYAQLPPLAGAGATATVTVGVGGGVTAVVITSGGTGYATGQLLTGGIPATVALGSFPVL